MNVLFIDFQTLNTVKLNLSKNRIHVHLKQDHRIKVQFQFANGSRNVAIRCLFACPAIDNSKPNIFLSSSVEDSTEVTIDRPRSGMSFDSFVGGLHV